MMAWKRRSVVQNQNKAGAGKIAFGTYAPVVVARDRAEKKHVSSETNSRGESRTGDDGI